MYSWRREVTKKTLSWIAASSVSTFPTVPNQGTSILVGTWSAFKLKYAVNTERIYVTISGCPESTGKRLVSTFIFMSTNTFSSLTTYELSIYPLPKCCTPGWQFGMLIMKSNSRWAKVKILTAFKGTSKESRRHLCWTATKSPWVLKGTSTKSEGRLSENSKLSLASTLRSLKSMKSGGVTAGLAWEAFHQADL